MKIRILPCHIADEEHTSSGRQYAHTFHYPNTVCVAHAFWSLPDSHFFGVLAHEIGHIISKGGENAADNIMLKKYGIRIKYASTDYGDFLQYLTPNDIELLLSILYCGSTIPIK